MPTSILVISGVVLEAFATEENTVFLIISIFLFHNDIFVFSPFDTPECQGGEFPTSVSARNVLAESLTIGLTV